MWFVCKRTVKILHWWGEEMKKKKIIVGQRMVTDCNNCYGSELTCDICAKEFRVSEECYCYGRGIHVCLKCEKQKEGKNE